MTAAAPAPRRLLAGLLAMPATTRALVGALQVHTTPDHASVACYSLLDPTQRLGGGAILVDDVDAQVLEVSTSGLFGATTLEHATDQASRSWRITCWIDQPHRGDALRTALAAGERGAALVAALTDEHLAQWRARQAAAAISGTMRSTAVDALRLLLVPSQAAGATTPPSATTPPAPTAPEPERQATPAPTGASALVRMKMGHSAPCVICGLPATDELEGHAVHRGECLRALTERINTRVPSENTPAVSPQAAPAGEPSLGEGPAPETEGAPTPALQEPPATESAPPATAADRSSKPARFRAPVAVLDAELAHLPGGQSEPWSAAHLGEIAMLAKSLRLGHGGGKALPDVGQVWLTGAAAERVGLPTVVPGAAIAPDEALTKSQAAKKISKAMAKVAQKGAVKDAVAAGWELGERGLDAWTRLSHPEHMPYGVWVVVAPWQRVTSVPLFVTDDDQGLTAPELADRLGTFANLVGTTYELTPPITTLQLVDQTRPPRPPDSPMGKPVSVQRKAPELPPFLREERYAQIERDFSWWRRWSSLSEQERAMPYACAWDRTWSYAAPWSSVYLGVEDLEHHTGDDAQWDGRAASVGYWLVDKWEWPHWGLPDPLAGRATTGFAAKDRLWVTTPTLEQLRMVDVHPVIHEAWRWHTTARYLEPAGKIITQALQGTTKGDPVHDTIKSMYRAGVSKFAQRDLRAGHHLGRRDWRDAIVAATRTQILYRLKEISERPGNRFPLVVSTDAIIYASPTADLVDGWVGDPKLLSSREAGKWKPLKAGQLATWGPEYLQARDGSWPYRDAMNALDGADQ